MNTQTRRYVFIDYENLLQIKFKKLEKVATKIFVFVEAKQETVPLSLVRQAQRSGKNLRWIVAGDAGSSGLNLHIAFVMGKLHQKLHPDVEFAVVSNDQAFDPLISFINDAGRNCIRVKRKKDESSVFHAINSEDDFIPSPSYATDSDDDDNDAVPVLVREEMITRTAEETVKRLIRSGNRPAEITNLKNYILLHNQELSLHGYVDKIIQKMKDSNDIEIRKGEVIYHF